MRTRVRWGRGALAGVILLGLGTDARAQLDQLLFLKRAQPNVILAVDTANRMQRDASEDYYDPFVYTRSGNAWEPTIGVGAATATTHYRRKYVDLQHLDPNEHAGDRFRADTIQTVGDLQAGYSTFEARTRLGIAQAALLQTIAQNSLSVRFGLLKTRQTNARIGSQGNVSPVIDQDASQSGANPTEVAGGKWKITRPEVDTTNAAAAATTAVVVRADAATQNSDITTLLNKTVRDAGALVPGGQDGSNVIDDPIANLLTDAKTEAARLIAADTLCRNTAVVLIVGGGEGTTSGGNPATTASQFLNVSGRRVPIFVIAIAPPAADVAQLQAVATNSGGQYFEITAAMINAVSAGTAVPDVIRAVNTAVQQVFARPADVNPSAGYPFGKPSQYQMTSPVVGTVEIAGAKDINGAALPNDVIYLPNTNPPQVIRQRSNVMITSEFELPGFTGRLRAFRMYKPVADDTKRTGYRFDKDGTKLWVSSLPAAGSRNIYTVLPDGTMTAFTTANAAALAPYLNVTDAASLITFVRALPMGAFVGSTPAFMDPPSLDPPPDVVDYPGFSDANKDRRTLLFIGGNDGMLHAIDARLGTEVWAFIPFNLLPKLQALQQGQSMDQFRYFVDSSAKIADVKIDGAWRTYLIIGEGAGGTFYQTFDVTLDGMAGVVGDTDDNAANVLSYFADPTRITFKWSFPLYSNFDTSLSPYGDVRATATAVEKSVGETWSDPAVGQIQSASAPYVVLVGSGFLKRSVETAANRSGAVAGTTFYVLNAKTGEVYDSRSVRSDDVAETVDSCLAANDCTKLKNALQADPVATGPADSRYITKTYIGDLDGRIWRFDLGLNGAGSPYITSAPAKLYDAGASQPLFASMATVNVGGAKQYLMVGTGSESLPTNGVDLSYKLLIVLDEGGTAGIKKAEILLARTSGGVGEWVTSFPAVAGEITFFSTNSLTSTGFCSWFSGALYAFTYTGGAAYDTTNDGFVTKNVDSTKVRTSAGNRMSAPFIVDQHLVVGAGTSVELFGDPTDFNNGVGQAGVRILSWREVR